MRDYELNIFRTFRFNIYDELVICCFVKKNMQYLAAENYNIYYFI